MITFKEYLNEMGIAQDVRNMKGSTKSGKKFNNKITRSIPKGFIEKEQELVKSFGLNFKIVNSTDEENFEVISDDINKIKKYLKASGVNSTDMKKWFPELF